MLDDLWLELDNIAGLNGRRILSSFVCFGLKHIARLTVCPLFDGTPMLQVVAATACVGGRLKET